MLAKSGLLPSRQDNDTVQMRAAEVNMSLAIHMYRPNGLHWHDRGTAHRRPANIGPSTKESLLCHHTTS